MKRTREEQTIEEPKAKEQQLTSVQSNVASIEEPVTPPQQQSIEEPKPREWVPVTPQQQQSIEEQKEAIKENFNKKIEALIGKRRMELSLTMVGPIKWGPWAVAHPKLQEANFWELVKFFYQRAKEYHYGAYEFYVLLDSLIGDNLFGFTRASDKVACDNLTEMGAGAIFKYHVLNNHPLICDNNLYYHSIETAESYRDVPKQVVDLVLKIHETKK